MPSIYPVTPESVGAVLAAGDPHDLASELVRAILLDAATPLQQLAALRQLSAIARRKARYGGGMLSPDDTRRLALFEALAPAERAWRPSADGVDRSQVTDVYPDAASHPAWPRFLRRLGPPQAALPPPALALAWVMFRDGWDGKIGQLQAAAADDWCEFWG